MNTIDFVPVNTPLLDGNEKKYLIECIDTGWISSEGPFVQRFEDEFAKRMGRKYGVAVTSGTAALDIAISALEITSGDEVILPTFTIISCVQQIIRSGATPVFVDCDPNTWNMDVATLEDKITNKTKAIMAVHIYGLPVDMNPILELCEKHQIKLIEDAAQAIGLNYNSKACGSFGDISTFSFYPNKNITTGEGGMILTNCDSLAQRSRDLRNLCFQSQKRFVHEELGWNYRMSNIQAAIGLAQLERLDEFVSKKEKIGALYHSLLSGHPEIQIPLREIKYARNNYWVFGIVLNKSFNLNATQAMEKLTQNKIGTRPFFYPLHKQPVLKHLTKPSSSFPVAENLYQRGFYIPSGLGLQDEDICYVANTIKAMLYDTSV